MRSIHSDTGLSKKVIIARVINNRPDEIVFTEKQMDQLYDLAVKCRNNSISREELIVELRGSGIENWVAAFGVIIAIITVLNNVASKNNYSTSPSMVIWESAAWKSFRRSITVTGATQNAGSEKKQPSSGSWNNIDVMKELEKQSSKKKD